MQQRALLDHLIELIKADYPDDWVRFLSSGAHHREGRQ
jgi:hypothetical protein